MKKNEGFFTPEKKLSKAEEAERKQRVQEYQSQLGIDKYKDLNVKDLEQGIAEILFRGCPGYKSTQDYLEHANKLTLELIDELFKFRQIVKAKIELNK
jgi:hypothetical protein